MNKEDVIGFGLLVWVFFCGIMCGVGSTDRAWTQYVIENGAMEWHCDSKTGETVLRWKE